jgi:hypothetical protein
VLRIPLPPPLLACCARRSGVKECTSYLKAILAYLSGFHASGLPRVAPYCVLGGIKVVSLGVHSCFTILLASGKRPNDVQHLAGHATIQLTLDHDMHRIPSRDRDTTDRVAKVLGSG